jgi:hypothetical protein
LLGRDSVVAHGSGTAGPSADAASSTAPVPETTDDQGKTLFASFVGKTRRLAFLGRKGIA